MSDTLLPPLPQLQGGDIDLMLDVYTHHTLRAPDQQMKGDYGDTSRLRDLGQKTLELVVTYILFSRREPMQSEEEIRTERSMRLSPENIELWVNTYGLKSKLRIAPNEVANVLNNPNEMAEFFYVYVGALYIRNGLGVIQSWISRLMFPGDPEVPLPNASAPPAFDGAHNQQMNQYMQQQQYMQNPTHGAHQTPPNQLNHFSLSPPMQNSQLFTSYTPPPPSNLPPPLPSSPSSRNYGQQPSSTLSLVTLALVNQTAAQRNIAVTYPADQEGPPHQPTWTVRCCMGGVERGRGVGKSQKAAKEDAARQAWAAMGWGPT